MTLVRHANSAYYSSMIMKYDPRVLGHASDKENGDLKLDMVGKWALRLGLIILPVAYALVDVGVGKFISDAHLLVGWYISPHGHKGGLLLTHGTREA